MSDTSTHSPTTPQHANVGHIAPLWLLAAVFGGLIVLTVVTVAVTYVDLGPAGNLAAAMLIALVKASLVALFFMHLWWDRPINAVVLISALAMVTVFILFALLDASKYGPNIERWRQENPLHLSDPYAPELKTSTGE